MRFAIHFSMCPTDLEKKLTAQQHLFPDFAQMKARIVTVINSRTRENLSDEDSNHHARKLRWRTVPLGNQQRQEGLH